MLAAPRHEAIYDFSGFDRRAGGRGHLRVGEADPAVIGLTGTCHNLLRFRADV